MRAWEKEDERGDEKGTASNKREAGGGGGQLEVSKSQDFSLKAIKKIH